jgi:hypothetical protein
MRRRRLEAYHELRRRSTLYQALLYESIREDNFRKLHSEVIFV